MMNYKLHFQKVVYYSYELFSHFFHLKPCVVIGEYVSQVHPLQAVPARLIMYTTKPLKEKHHNLSKLYIIIYGGGAEAFALGASCQ